MKMTNQKISTSLLLTLFTMCVLLFNLLPSVTAEPELPKMYFGDNRLLWKAGLLGDFQTTFLPQPPDLGTVAVDADEQKIYFMEYSNRWIRSMDLDGRNIEEVLSEERLEELDIGALGDEPGDSYINTVDGKVYWIAIEVDPDTGLTTLSQIWRMNLDGTGIEEVISVENRLTFRLNINEVGRRLYWLEDEQTDDSLYGFITTIRSSNLDGSDVKDHVTGIETYIYGFSIDNVNKHIYWIAGTEYESGTENYTILRAALDNPGDVVDVGEIVIDLGENFSNGIFVDGNNRIIYWFEQNYSLVDDDYLYIIRRANLDDNPPTPETVVETRSDWLNHGTISLALGKLYWTESDLLSTGEPIGSVWNVSLDGTEEPKNLSNIDFPGGIAVDTADEKLYWTVPNLGMIRQANIDGTDIVDLIIDLNQPEDIVISPADGKLYWTEIQDDVFFIQMATLDGTEMDTFASEDGFSKANLVGRCTEGSQKVKKALREVKEPLPFYVCESRRRFKGCVFRWWARKALRCSELPLLTRCDCAVVERTGETSCGTQALPSASRVTASPCASSATPSASRRLAGFDTASPTQPKSLVLRRAIAPR